MDAKSVPDLFERRRAMVRDHLEGRGVTDARVLEVFSRVRRELFVDPEFIHRTYEDGPLPIACDQTISQPYVVAWMVEMLGLSPTDRVLDIGTGSGYAAAILSELAGEVFTIERFEPLVDEARERFVELGLDRVHIRLGDGTVGWPEEAPFDAILVSAGGPMIPPTLRDQLTPGGRLVMPVGGDALDQNLLRLTRGENGRDRVDDFGPVRFVPLIGAEGWPGS